MRARSEVDTAQVNPPEAGDYYEDGVHLFYVAEVVEPLPTDPRDPVDPDDHRVLLENCSSQGKDVVLPVSEVMTKLRRVDPSRWKGD